MQSLDGSTHRRRRPRPRSARTASTSRRRRWRSSPASSRRWVCSNARSASARCCMMERLRAQRRSRSRAAGSFRATSSVCAGPWATPTSSWTAPCPYLRFCFSRGFLVAVGRAVRDLSPRAGRSSGRSFRTRWRDSTASALRAADARASSGSPAPHHRDARAGTRLHLQVLRRPGARDRRDAALLRARLLLQRERCVDLSRSQGAALGHGGRLLDPAGARGDRVHRLVGRGAGLARLRGGARRGDRRRSRRRSS